MGKSPIKNDMFCCHFARKALIIVVVFVLILVASDSFVDGSNVYNNNHADARSKVFLQRQILGYRCGHQYNQDSKINKATMPPKYGPPSRPSPVTPPSQSQNDSNAENWNNDVHDRKTSIQNEVRRVQDKQPVENDIEQYSYASPAKVRYQSKYYSADSTMRRTGLSTTSSHWKSDESKSEIFSPCQYSPPPPPPPPLYMEEESKVTEKMERSTAPVVVVDDHGDKEMMKDCESKEYTSNLTSTDITNCSEDDKTFGNLDLEEIDRSKHNLIEESKQNSEAMSKLQDSILQKVNIGKAQETIGLSSTIMNGLSAVGRQLMLKVISSVRTSQDSDRGKRNLLSDSIKPKFVIGDGDSSWSNVSIIQSDFDLIETKTKSSNNEESDSIWTSEERLLEQTVDLFSLYFDLWKIKSTFTVNRKQTKQEKSRNMNVPIPIQDSHLAFAIDHLDTILVSAFFNSAITKALVNEILFSSILPAVHSRIDNQRPPKKITVTRREKKVVTKTTRTRPTILSRINTDKDLDDIDFARLLVELESCNDEEVIEEYDYEYDAEPMIEEYQYDEITDNEVTHENDDYPEIEALSESVFEDDLLDDNDLEILEAAMLDSSSWFSDFVDESDSY